MIRHSLKLALGCIGGLLLSTGTASACSCAEPTLRHVLDSSDAIIYAQVTDVTQLDDPYGKALTQFRILTTLKDKHESLPQTISVQHRTDSASCGVSYRKDQEYLVLLQRVGRRYSVGGLCFQIAAYTKFNEIVEKLGHPELGQ